MNSLCAPRSEPDFKLWLAKQRHYGQSGDDEPAFHEQWDWH